MTVSSTTTKASYSGNGSTTVFAVPFYFLQNADLLVILRSSAGVETTQVFGTNYTLTGAGNENGGSLTMTVAPPTGTTLTILRNAAATQETDLLPNDRLPAESLETALDKLTMLVQQLDEENDRALKFAQTDSTASTTLPTAPNRANKFLSFDGSGNPIFVGATDPYTVGVETKIATQGQTVFTLSTISYTPGINNLSVFVDGVNQVNGTAYTETNSTTVTFSQGLHAGAIVKFSTVRTLSSSTIDSAAVPYLPAGTGAVLTNVQAKLRETVSVKDFGAVGDGVTDDTAAIQTAIDYVYDNNVGTLYFPSGNYIITKSLLVWGAQANPYFAKSTTMLGQDRTNTKISKITNNGYGGASPYANDDAIFVLARRDLTSGNNVGVGSITIRNFFLNGNFGSGKVAFGIFNRCSAGNCIFDQLEISAAIGFRTTTDFYLSSITNVMCAVDTHGISMLASGTSVYLKDVFVNGASVKGYELRGGYSSADSIACDYCTGICYSFEFADWVVNGLGSESADATTVIAASNSNVIINNPFIFPQNSALAKIFDISSYGVTVNGGYIGGGAGIPTSRPGQLAAVGATARFQLNNTRVIDTYAVPSSNRFTHAAGASKSGVVSVPSGVATTLRALEDNEVGIFIAYANNDNANIYAVAYVGNSNNAGLAQIANNVLSLSLVGTNVKVTQSSGSAINVAYQYLVFGERLLP